MTCPCNKPKTGRNGRNPRNVIEVHNDCPVLFHQVIRPASLGDDVQTPPQELNYKNVLLVYQANGHVYLYSSDGIPTFISYLPTEQNVDELKEQLAQLAEQLQLEVSNREEADSQLDAKIETNTSELAKLSDQLTAVSDTMGQQIDGLQDAVTALDNEVSATQSAEVQKDTAVSADASTVTLTKTTGELTGEGVATGLPLPVADSTQAGVMNAATFSAVQENSENIDSILGGAVVIDDLPASPTQDELTAQWKAETGKTKLINRASIYDKTNGKIWYYYTNASEWEPADIQNPEVTVSVATNDSLGIVKGSDDVFIEPDGSMSVVGLDKINSDIENLSEKVDGIEVPKVGPYTLYSNNSIPNYFVGQTGGRLSLRTQMIDTSTGAQQTKDVLIPQVTTSLDGLMPTTDKVKLDNLPAITEIGENLELTEDGTLNATGGGEVEVPKVSNLLLTNESPDGTYTRTLWVTTNAGDSPAYPNGSVKLQLSTVNTQTGAKDNLSSVMPFANSVHPGAMSPSDKSKLDSLLEIKSLNDSLSLDENGQLSVVGGGGDGAVNLLAEYTAAPTSSDTYNASYLNSKIDYGTFYNMGNGTAKGSMNLQPTNGGGSVVIANGNIFQSVSPSATYTISPGTVLLGSGTAHPNRYNQYSIDYGVGIGSWNLMQAEGIAIGSGSNAVVNGAQGVAIGYGTKVNNLNSIALGRLATTTRDCEVAFGFTPSDTSWYPDNSGNPVEGWDGCHYLANVKAGELDTDAVNVSQLNAALARIEALEAEVAALKS